MGDHTTQNAPSDVSSEPNASRMTRMPEASFEPDMTPADLPPETRYTERATPQTASYDINLSRVDTGAIRETAALVRAKLRAVDEAQAALRSTLQSLEACWQGSAADAYVEAYQKLLKGLESTRAAYGAYPDILDQNAEDREVADSQATMYATSIELPHWAQV